jgi:hypothetical protein
VYTNLVMFPRSRKEGAMAPERPGNDEERAAPETSISETRVRVIPASPLGRLGEQLQSILDSQEEAFQNFRESSHLLQAPDSRVPDSPTPEPVEAEEQHAAPWQVPEREGPWREPQPYQQPGWFEQATAAPVSTDAVVEEMYLAAIDYLQEELVSRCPARGTLSRCGATSVLRQRAREILFAALGEKEMDAAHGLREEREEVALDGAIGDLEQAAPNELRHFFRVIRRRLKRDGFRALIRMQKRLLDRHDEGGFWFPEELAPPTAPPALGSTLPPVPPEVPLALLPALLGALPSAVSSESQPLAPELLVVLLPAIVASSSPEVTAAHSPASEPTAPVTPVIPPPGEPESPVGTPRALEPEGLIKGLEGQPDEGRRAYMAEARKRNEWKNNEEWAEATEKTPHQVSARTLYRYEAGEDLRSKTLERISHSAGLPLPDQTKSEEPGDSSNSGLQS